MSKIRKGTRIKITSNGLYRSRWLEPGEEGSIVIPGSKQRGVPYAVLMDKDNKRYSLSLDVFELIE